MVYFIHVTKLMKAVMVMVKFSAGKQQRVDPYFQILAFKFYVIIHPR
jgi:hypothetical protein